MLLHYGVELTHGVSGYDNGDYCSYLVIALYVVVVYVWQPGNLKFQCTRAGQDQGGPIQQHYVTSLSHG